MRRYFEYGAFAAALLTLAYLIAAIINGLTINIMSVFMCIGGGLIAGVLVSILLLYSSPGEHIQEGEEDIYIKR